MLVPDKALVIWEKAVDTIVIEAAVKESDGVEDVTVPAAKVMRP